MKTTKTNDTILIDAIRTMDGRQFQEIRDAYYKAVEGLHSLAEALENAIDLDTEGGQAIFGEHAIACRAIVAMNHSALGRIV
jgi:N-acetylglutamate synthase/N-acetylornithine aminotransferase